MSRKLKILLSIPRTLYFNFRYLKFSQAIRIPVWLANNVRIKNMFKGGMVIENIHFNSVHIGFHEADGLDTYSVKTILDVRKGGCLVLKSTAHIGQGASLVVHSEGKLTLGRNFAISGTTSIICSKSITFGDDVQLSWNSMIMDSDAHRIYSTDGKWINPPTEITVGNRVWIAANTSIMKGAVIKDNTVVASNSLVNKAFSEGNCILAGQPAKVVKQIGGFAI